MEGEDWSRGEEEAGVKSGTRLVPAFHSHWPCRSLYRCSSSSSSFFFFSSSTSSSSAPYSYSLLPAEKERGRGILLDRLPPHIFFVFSSSSSFYFGRLLNVNRIGALRGPSR